MFSVSSTYAPGASRATRTWPAWLIIASTVLLFPIAGCSGAGANAPAPSPSATASANSLSTDPAVDRTLETSCFDCHSDQKIGPWNARLAPSYLFGAGDARTALNFSAWNSYDASRKSAELSAIAKVIEHRSMPPWDYDFLHPAARLTAQQRLALLRWAAHGHVPNTR